MAGDQLQWPCASCGEPLPMKGNKRRHVPGRGGRKLIVCPLCADRIDQQTTLGEPDGGLLGTRRPAA